MCCKREGAARHTAGKKELLFALLEGLRMHMPVCVSSGFGECCWLFCQAGAAGAGVMLAPAVYSLLTGT